MTAYDFFMVQGSYGSGKTLFMTWLGKTFHERFNKVYANYYIDSEKIPNFEQIDGINADIWESLEKDSLLLISEAYKYVDKRECNKKENIKISQSIQEIRKDGYFLVMDCIASAMLDFRFLNITTGIFNASGNLYDNYENYFIDNNFNIDIPIEFKDFFVYEYGHYDILSKKIIFDSSFYLDMRETYELYNTKERIKKLERKKEKKD